MICLMKDQHMVFIICVSISVGISNGRCAGRALLKIIVTLWVNCGK